MTTKRIDAGDGKFIVMKNAREQIQDGKSVWVCTPANRSVEWVLEPCPICGGTPRLEKDPLLAVVGRESTGICQCYYDDYYRRHPFPTRLLLMGGPSPDSWNRWVAGVRKKAEAALKQPPKLVPIEAPPQKRKELTAASRVWWFGTGLFSAGALFWLLG